MVYLPFDVMKKNNRTIEIWLLISSIIYSSYTIFTYYLKYKKCGGNNSLTWDGNLRYIEAIKISESIRNLEFFPALQFFFSSPTWPPFRILLSSFLILFQSEPEPYIDVFISTFFFASSIPVFYLIIRELIKNLTTASGIFFLLILNLFFIKEFPSYIFSSMLETQGIFFLSIFILAYLKIKKENNNLFLTLLLIGFTGTFFTKYPYGIILILSVFITEFIFNLKGFYITYIIISNYLSKHKIYLILLILPIFVFPIILILKKVHSGKIISYFLYLSSVIYFTILHLALYKNRLDIKKQFNELFKNLYLYGIVPAAVWMLIHFDRFRSILDSREHIQDSGRYFIISVFTEVFINTSIPISLLFFLISGIILFILNNSKNYSFYLFKSAASKYLSSNSFYPMHIFIKVSLIIFFQYLILELSTSNKQLRHIYHLLPAALLLLMVFPFLVFENFTPSQNNRISNYISTIFFLISVPLPFILFSNSYSKFYSKINVCYSVPDLNYYRPAEILSSHISQNGNILYFNHLHSDPGTLYARDISTDIDLAVYRRTYKQGQITVLNKNIDISNKYNSLITVSKNCSFNPLAIFNFSSNNAKLKRLNYFSYHDKFCIQEFSFHFHDDF